MAIVAEGDRGRVYLPPTAQWKPWPMKPNQSGSRTSPMGESSDGSCHLYGVNTFGDLFTASPTGGVDHLVRLVQEARAKPSRMLIPRVCPTIGKPLCRDVGADAYGDAVAIYLAFAH